MRSLHHGVSTEPDLAGGSAKKTAMGLRRASAGRSTEFSPPLNSGLVLFGWVASGGVERIELLGVM